jgi:hypothetical protein
MSALDTSRAAESRALSSRRRAVVAATAEWSVVTPVYGVPGMYYMWTMCSVGGSLGV